jgi:hypothetical protein
MLDESARAANRIDHGDVIRTYLLNDDTAHEPGPSLEKVTLPVLSGANPGGQRLHLRGNVEGFLRAGSRHPWLDVHGRSTGPSSTPTPRCADPGHLRCHGNTIERNAGYRGAVSPCR